MGVADLRLKQMQVPDHIQSYCTNSKDSVRDCVQFSCLLCASVFVTDPAVGSPLRWVISKGQDFKEIPKAMLYPTMKTTIFSLSLSTLWVITVFLETRLCLWEKNKVVYCIVLSEVEFETTYVSCRVVYSPLLVSHAVLLLNDMHTCLLWESTTLVLCLSASL